MNRLLSLATLAALALIFLAGASQIVVPPPAPRLNPLEITIEIAPTPPGPYELLRERFPDTFSCRARLNDPETHTIVGAATVTVSPGSEATRTVTMGELTIILKGKVGGARTSAVADLTVLRNGQLITHQKSTLMLAGAGRQSFY